MTPDSRPGLVSWTAPNQPVEIYHLSSLVAPLLANMFLILPQHLLSFRPQQIPFQNLLALYQFHKTLSKLLILKPDIYADIMDVLAFDEKRCRRRAIEVLTTFWPRAFGHLVISRPLGVMSYPERLRELGLIQPQGQRERHEWILWRYQSPLNGNGVSKNRITANCAVCNKAIIGLGLYCPCCTLTVHPTSCYDHGGAVDALQYDDASLQGGRHIAKFRFSHLTERLDQDPKQWKRRRHVFERVHLFSLCLCYLCQRPLWGAYSQAVRCSNCYLYAHRRCIDKAKDCRKTPFSAEHVKIPWAALRKSWREEYKELIWTEERMLERTWEEVSVAYGVFWMEHELLIAGIAAGTIMVEYAAQRRKDSRQREGEVDHFELPHCIALYYTQLSGTRLAKSKNTMEYIENCGPLDAEVSLLHNLQLLLLAGSVVKLPLSDGKKSGDEWLTVGDEEIQEDELMFPFEVVSLAHIRDALGYEVNLHSDSTAKLLMGQLHRIGIFTLMDTQLDALEIIDANPGEILCSFPSTLAIDASTSVEALFAAIQACLDDLDLSINEFGLLLLTRKCWPNGLMTDYALSRLTSLVLSWILTEDDRLLLVVRDYISSREPSPGVRLRLAGQKVPWPDLGQLGSTGSGAGTAEYTLTRRSLVLRYAMPWLLKVHEQNRPLYAECLYRECVVVSGSSKNFVEHDHEDREDCEVCVCISMLSDTLNI